jgi:hypothetical protein
MELGRVTVARPQNWSSGLSTPSFLCSVSTISGRRSSRERVRAAGRRGRSSWPHRRGSRCRGRASPARGLPGSMRAAHGHLEPQPDAVHRLLATAHASGGRGRPSTGWERQARAAPNRRPDSIRLPPTWTWCSRPMKISLASVWPTISPMGHARSQPSKGTAGSVRWSSSGSRERATPAPVITSLPDSPPGTGSPRQSIAAISRPCSGLPISPVGLGGSVPPCRPPWARSGRRVPHLAAERQTPTERLKTRLSAEAPPAARASAPLCQASTSPRSWHRTPRRARRARAHVC